MKHRYIKQFPARKILPCAGCNHIRNVSWERWLQIKHRRKANLNEGRFCCKTCYYKVLGAPPKKEKIQWHVAESSTFTSNQANAT